MCYDIAYSGRLQDIPTLIPAFPLAALRGLSLDPCYHVSGHSYPSWPVLLHEEGGLRLRFLEWGLVAPYMNTPERIRSQRPWMLNARSERILDDSKSYWHRIRHHRCIVPVSGFFEHRDVGRSRKIPYYLSATQAPLLLLAGLYQYASQPDPDTGELGGSFSIITRAANALLKAIHNSGENRGRMPLMLDGTQAQEWLRPDLGDADIRRLLDVEMPSDALNYRPVRSIRRPHAQTPEVLDPEPYEGLPPVRSAS